jgi:predicted Zn-ribbon and HTH transcriptional regulator
MKTPHSREYPTREPRKERVVDRAEKKARKLEEQRATYEVKPLVSRECSYEHSADVWCPNCDGFEE